MGERSTLRPIKKGIRQTRIRKGRSFTRSLRESCVLEMMMTEAENSNTLCIVLLVRKHLQMKIAEAEDCLYTN
jgi:hypothetical protein